VTRLEAFRIANGLKSMHLAEESGVSRAYVARLRLGTIDPTRAKMLAIRDGCSRLLGRRVYLGEVFDLGGDPVTVVTPAHGDIFARVWFEQSLATMAMDEAFEDTKLMAWPDDPDAQAEFQNIEDEIHERVFDAARQTIADAFTRVAADVLARERSR